MSLVVLGIGAAVLGGFGPLLVELMADRRRRRDQRRKQREVWQVADLPMSTALLLHPARRIVPFAGRIAQLDALSAWSVQDAALPVRLIVAPGGYGKTRLAHQFADAMSRKRWTVWPIKAGGEDVAAASILDDKIEKRLLIVIDYAETRQPNQLAALMAAVLRQNRSGQAHVRLLLLARRVGPWWQYLSRFADGDSALVESVTGSPDCVVNLPSRADDRTPESIVADAATAFHTQLRGLNHPAGLHAAPTTIRLPADAGQMPLLRLHAYALTAVLNTAADTTDRPPTTQRPDVLDEVLLHETRYWHDRVQRTSPPLIPRSDPEHEAAADTLLRQLCGAACLLGANSDDEVVALVARTPALAGVAGPDRRRWADWLIDLYPRDPTDGAAGDGLGTLQPDLLAEHLAAGLLTSCTPKQLDELFAAISDEQAEHALTVIGRAVGQHPHLVSLFGQMLAAAPAPMTGAVITVARQFPRLYTPHLKPLLPGALNPDQMRRLAEKIPYPSLELGEIAVILSKAIAARPTSQDDHARWLTWHALRLAEAGRRAEALAVSQEAVDLRRELAGLNRDAYLPDLATSVNNHALRLAEAGRRAEALAVSQEAVDLRRELAGLNRDAYLPDLAMSVNNHAAFLAEAGRRAEALAVSQEAVDLYRELAGLNRDAYLPNLAMSVNNHANRLAEAGRRAEALTRIDEAIEYYRELAVTEPTIHMAKLEAAQDTRMRIIGGDEHRSTEHRSTGL